MGFSVLTLTFKLGFLLFPNLQCQTTAVSNMQQHPPSSCHLWYHIRVEGGVGCKPETLTCHLESWTRVSWFWLFTLSFISIMDHHHSGGNYTEISCFRCCICPVFKHSEKVRRSDVFPNVPHTFIPLFFPQICGQFKNLTMRPPVQGYSPQSVSVVAAARTGIEEFF